MIHQALLKSVQHGRSRTRKKHSTLVLGHVFLGISGSGLTSGALTDGAGPDGAMVRGDHFKLRRFAVFTQCETQYKSSPERHVECLRAEGKID